jgi:hypothetical protein
MSKALLLILVLLALVAAPHAEATDLTGKTSNYAVVVHFEKGEPVKGMNHASIAVTDSIGKPATGIRQVKIDYFMPSLPGKSPMMESSTVARGVDGNYTAALDLSMKGEWTIVTSIVTSSKTDKVSLTCVVK